MEKRFTIQRSPFVVPTDDGKIIKEHFGEATNTDSDLSLAHMTAPPQWSEPFQTPDFDEYTFIIKGKKQFTIEGEIIILNAGESIKIEKGTKIQYANPFNEPCEYISICRPSFTIDSVHREDEK